MRLNSVCLLGLLGVEVLCFGAGSKSTVIDSSCDMREVKLPQAWKDECIEPDTGKLRPGLDAKTRLACVSIAGNNRELKRKNCLKS